MPVSRIVPFSCKERVLSVTRTCVLIEHEHETTFLTLFSSSCHSMHLIAVVQGSHGMTGTVRLKAMQRTTS